MNGSDEVIDNPPEGVTVTRNNNNFLAIRIHYTAVPAFRSDEWIEKAKAGFDKADRWEQEMEINFTLAGTSKVYPMFNYEKHVRKLAPIKELPLLVGWDFGYHHPAVVVAQIDTYDRLCILHEDMGNDITIQKYGKHVKKMLKEKFQFHTNSGKIYHFGDPAGNQQNDKSEFTSIQILRKMNIFIKWRRASIKQGVRIIQQLMMEREDSTTGFKIDPSCKLLIDGFSGGYTEDLPNGQRASKELPFEDDYYSHVADCVRYLVINKYPAHGILYKNSSRTFRPSYDDPLSDSNDLHSHQSRITGYY